MNNVTLLTSHDEAIETLKGSGFNNWAAILNMVLHEGNNIQKVGDVNMVPHFYNGAHRFKVFMHSDWQTPRPSQAAQMPRVTNLVLGETREACTQTLMRFASTVHHRGLTAGREPALEGVGQQMLELLHEEIVAKKTAMTA